MPENNTSLEDNLSANGPAKGELRLANGAAGKIPQPTVDNFRRPDTLSNEGPPSGSQETPPALFDPSRVALAQRVWSRQYQRPVTEQEAVEILLTVRRMAKVLREAVQRA